MVSSLDAMTDDSFFDLAMRKDIYFSIEK